MDVGKKCLFMAILGMVLTLVSSPFVINMVFTGKPFTVLVAKEVLEPVPPNEYGPISKTITRMEKIMENLHLNPAKGEQYRVNLNVVTNGTIKLLVFRVNSTSIITHSFNAGNSTIELRITDEGFYVLNATSVGNSAVNATFIVKESWFIKATEWKAQVDLLRTVGPSVGFAAGVIMLVYSLIKLRREARAPHSGAAGEKDRIEYEVEEE